MKKFVSSVVGPTAITSSATAVTLASAEPKRVGLFIFNDSTAVLYVKFGTGASSTDFTVKMLAGAYYEMPTPYYTGVVSGVWASANGFAYVTELI